MTDAPPHRSPPPVCRWSASLRRSQRCRADELLQHGFSDGHHHGRGGRVLSHMERNTVQHMKPNTSLQHKQNTCSSQSRSTGECVVCGVCVCVCVCVCACVWYVCVRASVCVLHLLNTYMPGLAPATMTIRRAMRLCRFHFSMEAARQITPISNSVVSLKYSEATCKHTGSCSKVIEMLGQNRIF